MKKSLYLLSLVIIVFFITDRVVFFSIQNIEKKVYSGQSVGKANHFLKIKDSVDLLVFGSSRANRHLYNKILDSNSFNMGVDGNRIGYSAALISTLEKNNQTILVHIDQERLFDNEYKGDDILALINLIKRQDTIKDFVENYFPEEYYLSKLFNSYTYNGKIFGIFKNRIKPKYDYKQYDGFDGLFPSIEQKQIFEKLINSKDLDLKNNFFEEDNALTINPIVNRLIDRIIDTCSKNNSKLIFFTSPSLYTVPEKARVKSKLYFDKKRVSYYDYSNFFLKFNADYWKDFTHMSNKGAIIFTKDFKEKILN